MDKKTQLMAILNATPDSFFSNSRFTSLELAIQAGLEMANQGADILDIGGESTRPKNVYQSGQKNLPLTIDEEIQRVIPLIEALHEKINTPISIDTRHAKVAELAIEKGASLINDVSGFKEKAMREVAASSNCTLCVMHMQGSPENMQLNPHYDQPIIDYLKSWFTDTLEMLNKEGIKEERIILDPGIGFGKTVAHNIEIIQNLHELKKLGFPLLLGISRKQFMGKLLNGRTPEELLFPTIAMNTIAILADVDYIRVHDVKEHREIIDLLTAYKK